MFNNFHEGFRSKTESKLRDLESKLRELECQFNYLKEKLNFSAERITILGKLVTKKEFKIIENPKGLWIIGDREELLDAERAKCRAEGLSFCHKMKDGDEIWAKYDI
jgi:hypothetical protein